MDEIKGFGLVISILMVLMAYLKQMIPRGKTMPIMRMIITVFILFSIFDGVRNFNFGELSELVNYSYSENDKVWLNASNAVADGLVREFNTYLDGEGVSARAVKVEVKADHNGFEIARVVLKGREVNVGKMMIAARFQVSETNIEVMYE